jgi:hypothetical protein
MSVQAGRPFTSCVDGYPLWEIPPAASGVPEDTALPTPFSSALACPSG